MLAFVRQCIFHQIKNRNSLEIIVQERCTHLFARETSKKSGEEWQY